MTATVQNAGGAVITLATNFYDYPGNPFVHNDAPVGVTYWVDLGHRYRGNVTKRTVPGSVTNFFVNAIGVPVRVNDDHGHSTSVTTDASKGYAVPNSVDDHQADVQALLYPGEQSR